jgi:hypothetical protein
MSDASFDVERLLRQALTPVEPPERLRERLEHTLTTLTAAAADELEAWELRAMRDPRNWARPAAALVVGTTAGAALVVVRARQHQRRGRGGLAGSVGRAVREVAVDPRRLLG